MSDPDWVVLARERECHHDICEGEASSDKEGSITGRESFFDFGKCRNFCFGRSAISQRCAFNFEPFVNEG